ncbi:hypothetical protein NIE79_002051 [Micromonospora sp. NIE79]|uniref:HTTM domain-containing protein n=1 Tax=Micromonospora trifolii TaxID=2911208 RepID=A0ABS9N1U5_9ACTN|nr:hypothetical protein [Micromonospora trifolii]MCG5443907.1 hypothetical protein [Micromonospora trifolii]
MDAELFLGESTVATTFSLAARVAGVALLVTGLELAAGLPGLARWRRPGLPVGRRWITAHQILATALGLLGGWFVVDPRVCLNGGGLVALLVVGYLMVALQPLGDGADVMLVIVLAGLGVLSLVPSPALSRWAAWLVAVNVCVAYWWSGVAKLRIRAWRHGRQIALAVNSPRFGSPWVAWRFLNHAKFTQLTAWGVMTLEVSCPVFFVLGGWPLLAWAFCAVLMHVGVALIMGLGRFLWAFGAGLLSLVAVRSMV